MSDAVGLADYHHRSVTSPITGYYTYSGAMLCFCLNKMISKPLTPDLSSELETEKKKKREIIQNMRG